MEPKIFEAVYAILDTVRCLGCTKEEALQKIKEEIKGRHGHVDWEILRILPHEESVQKGTPQLKDVIKVQEPLRSWPSPAAIAAHKKNGGRWLCEREMMFGPPVVRIDVFYENGVFTDYQRKGCVSPPLKFGPVDIDYNRMPWPTDGEGNPL